MSFIALFAWIFINEIADFFCSEVGAKNYAISYLKYNFLSLPFLSICVIFAATLIGAGAAHLNFICCAISLWVFELPCAMILSKILNDANAIFIAILTAKIAETMMLVWIFFNVKFEKYAMKS